jgi:hypothetical protein
VGEVNLAVSVVSSKDGDASSEAITDGSGTCSGDICGSTGGTAEANTSTTP